MVVVFPGGAVWRVVAGFFGVGVSAVPAVLIAGFVVVVLGVVRFTQRDDGVGIGFAAVDPGEGVVELAVNDQLVAAGVGAEDLVDADGVAQLGGGEAEVFEFVVCADVAGGVVDADEAVGAEVVVGDVFGGEYLAVGVANLPSPT